MLAVNYSTLRNNLKDYCDTVTDDYETVIVTRKDEKNVVLISLEEYNALTKAAKNAAYLSMLDRSMAQIESGNTITKTMEDLAGMLQQGNILILSCKGHYVE
ncbi:MAG: type II toxin-antitoxin system Phd/YefM family antitoxin [Clostridiales bacterium]|nr:type II toxin-antitoxin system Phd/YefM family antitoxin [Clostridiales bacterium]